MATFRIVAWPNDIHLGRIREKMLDVDGPLVLRVWWQNWMKPRLVLVSVFFVAFYLMKGGGVGWSQCFLSVHVRTQVLQCWCVVALHVYPDTPSPYYHITSFVSPINCGCSECLRLSNSWLLRRLTLCRTALNRAGWGMCYLLRVVEAWNLATRRWWKSELEVIR